KALAAVRGFTKRSVRVVFGCGGDRDKLKRPLMGSIAATLADEIWITSDNPRHENPDEIIAQIVDGIDASLRHKVKVMPDRKKAIHDAVGGARLEDMVLIAGKGHEATQQVGDEFLPFSDKVVAQEVLEAWKE